MEVNITGITGSYNPQPVGSTLLSRNFFQNVNRLMLFSCLKSSSGFPLLSEQNFNVITMHDLAPAYLPGFTCYHSLSFILF